MNPVLPDLAVEFGTTAEKAVLAAGGADLARRAESDPGRRAGEVARVLENLGTPDLDPTADLDAALAAGELCRVAGRYALPYPVVAFLLRDSTGRPLAVTAGDRLRVDHGDLFPAWVLAGLDGRVRYGRPAGGPLGSKLGPFVTDLEAEPDSRGSGAGDLLMPLALTLQAWRILGAVERGVQLAVEHVKGREQFGQPLSGFQAVQFQLADAAVGRDGLEELCRYSTWRLFDDPAGRLVDALALRLHACDVARAALRTAQQLFGAAGLCDEYDISVLCRHVQPDLRLPAGAEQTAARLFDAVAADGFEGLFPHGGPRDGRDGRA